MGGGGSQQARPHFRTSFIVSNAARGTVWEDLRNIQPPTYNGNPLNLDRFLVKVDDWGMTVTEDMDPAKGQK